MSEKINGGPAFPCGEQYQVHSAITGTVKHSKGPLHGGMTLRDYFAANALAGQMATEGDETTFDAEKVARRSYQFADAMLKAREA